MMGLALTGKESSIRVLIIDDEAPIRTTLSGVLKDEGFEVEVAENGEAGLKLLKESSNFSAVLLDIWMPGLDGIQTLEEIKRLFPEIPVIIISGHATIQNALEATRKGAFDFIEKPFRIESILLSLERALGGRGDKVDEGATYDHPGILSTAFSGRNLGQRTLKRGALLYGHCLHSGQKSGLILEPLPPDSGIHFAPIGDARSVPAHVDFVQSTGFATTLRNGTSSAATIEHLMSALHSYGISNLLVKCNAEVPIFDGSALEFCRIIEEVGVLEQGGEWFELVPDREFTYTTKSSTTGKETITISPSDKLTIRYELRYPEPVGEQVYEFTFDGVESFKDQIAPARTFGFMKDVEKLQKAGLAAGGRLDNFILIGENGAVNTELRFPEELARHKVLDAIGDLYLIGRPLRARVNCVMTGHSDNVDILKLIWQAMAA
jgi:UDP-3-O-[3-hydroxymyristoyl] N-acetylglucosamine deacetylase